MVTFGAKSKSLRKRWHGMLNTESMRHWCDTAGISYEMFLRCARSPLQQTRSFARHPLTCSTSCSASTEVPAGSTDMPRGRGKAPNHAGIAGASRNLFLARRSARATGNAVEEMDRRAAGDDRSGAD
jgi:hypothetical protein